jgi:Cu(I)/Ag(I) efflux system membrane fusion protein
MPGDFGKNAKSMLNAAKQKLLFYGLSNSQIESIKTTTNIAIHYFYSTYSGYVSEVLATEGSYVMEEARLLK